MKNTFGQSLAVTVFGESHGEMIGTVIDGIAPGIPVDTENIKRRLALRRPSGKISTSRREEDEFSIVSGVYQGYTTGTPVCILIPNKNTKSSDYSELADKPRPGHADYTATCKYHGFQDPRGGGHFSGRITAPIVAAAALIEPALRARGIFVATHISSLYGISDREFSDYTLDASILSEKTFPVLSQESEERMRSAIESAAEEGDSVGGILESVIYGLPSGLGDPYFDSLESTISHAVFSVPGIKGVEFGSGFGFASLKGSAANDAIMTDGERIYTSTNHNGGINGGISNGMPVILRAAVKPTPSIFKQQNTVSLEKMENTTLTISGRHDPAIIHRARAVIDATLILAVADALTVRYGTDYLGVNDNNN